MFMFPVGFLLRFPSCITQKTTYTNIIDVARIFVIELFEIPFFAHFSQEMSMCV